MMALDSDSCSRVHYRSLQHKVDSFEYHAIGLLKSEIFSSLEPLCICRPKAADIYWLKPESSGRMLDSWGAVWALSFLDTGSLVGFE